MEDRSQSTGGLLKAVRLAAFAMAAILLFAAALWILPAWPISR